MADVKIIKVFLASSSELKGDREQFEIFINRKNKEYIKQSIFLELVLWEDFLDAMSATRLQDEYNKAIGNCDVFVSLFHTKVGQYTEEEFSKALATFKLNQKPLVYTYFRISEISTDLITPEIISLFNFQERLKSLEHFYQKYRYIEVLTNHFNQQLNKFLPKLADTIEVTFQPEKQESDKSGKFKIRQLEQELAEARSHNQKLEKLYQDHTEKKESKINQLQNTVQLQQKQIVELTKKLSDIERPHNQQLNQLNITSELEKHQLEQLLSEERSLFYQISRSLIR